MSYEKEVKVLDIDIESVKSKLLDLGAELIMDGKQKIYTYDIPSISARYNELLYSDIDENIKMKKFKELAFEIDDLIYAPSFAYLKPEYDQLLLGLNINKLQDAYTYDLYILKRFIYCFDINPNKWIRLRQQPNGKTTLTTKHVLINSSENIQKVIEHEVEVSDIEEMNAILVSMGCMCRNVQEKYRTQFKFNNAEIDIDLWPHLKPYIEIECDDESIYNKIITLLDLSDKQVISCNTDELYKQEGIDIKKMPELLFNK